jgi:drug/metabolite transporter (DMT)-like permease
MTLKTSLPGGRSASVARETDRVGKGIAMILTAVMLFSVCDALAKWLGLAGYSAPQIAFFRYLFGLIPVAIMVWKSGTGVLKTRRPFAHALRALLMFASLISLFNGLRWIPLAEAISIVLTVPLFITVLSYPVLGERVGPRRVIAAVVGFVGVLIMMRPGSAAFQVESLWLIAAALFFASAMLFTRRISRTETSVSILAYTTIGAFVASIPMAGLDWTTPSTEHIWVFLTIGMLGGTASFCMILAYTNAPAAVVAPFEYTALVWAAAIGWLVWAETPGLAVWIGAAVIVACGLYITRREGMPSGVE